MTSTRSSQATHQHELARWLSFWLERHLIPYLPKLLSHDDQLFISEPGEITSPKQSSIAALLTALVETREFVVMSHDAFHDVTVTSRLDKNPILFER